MAARQILNTRQGNMPEETGIVSTLAREEQRRGKEYRNERCFKIRFVCEPALADESILSWLFLC